MNYDPRTPPHEESIIRLNLYASEFDVFLAKSSFEPLYLIPVPFREAWDEKKSSERIYPLSTWIIRYRFRPLDEYLVWAHFYREEKSNEFSEQREIRNGSLDYSTQTVYFGWGWRPLTIDDLLKARHPKQTLFVKLKDHG
jgi:hypothetical protein